MAKRELTDEEKHLRKMEKCRQYYDAINSEIGLEGDDINQMHQLVEAGVKVQRMIDIEAAKISEEGLVKAEEMLTIDSPTWNEFVNITAKKMYGNLSEKSVEKMNEKIESKRYINNLQQAFYDSYLADETLKKVDEEGSQDFRFDKEEDSEFASLIEEYAKIVDYINKVLRVRMKSLCHAAFFITNGKVEPKDFKDMVRWECYKDSVDAPSVAWSIYSKFARMYRLLYDYKFDQIDELDKEFGYDIEVGTPHPTVHPWDKDDEE